MFIPDFELDLYLSDIPRNEAAVTPFYADGGVDSVATVVIPRNIQDHTHSSTTASYVDERHHAITAGKFYS